MKNEFLLREEFKQWLLNVKKFSLPVTNSYLSYVAGVDKTIGIYVEKEDFTTNLFTFIKEKVELNNIFEAESGIVSVFNYLFLENIDKKLETPLNTIKNWRTGMIHYREFIYEYMDSKIYDTSTNNTIENNVIDDFNDIEIEDPKIKGSLLGFVTENLEKNIFRYSKDDLYKNFAFRIITQDRRYEQIFYPISFIKRFLYLKNEKVFFDNWLEILLDNIYLHFENDKIKLKDITELSIENKQVFVNHNNESKLLFTKHSNNIDIQPFCVDELRNIAIDHEEPLVKIMTENLHKFNVLKDLTNEIKKYINGKVDSNNFKIANKKVLESDYVDKINIDRLKNELNFILDKSNLQLMDSNQNNKKKAN